MVQRHLRLVALLLAALPIAACGGNTSSPPASGTPAAGEKTQINGAGATFPNPIYSKWFSEYNKLHPNVKINYQSIGSGGGIRQLSAGTVFFGASDGPMTNDQIGRALCREREEMSVVVGAVN